MTFFRTLCLVGPLLSTLSLSAQPSVTPPPVLPALTGPQRKAVDKPSRKIWEQCSQATTVAAAAACIPTADTARQQLHEPSLELLAAQRACALGLPEGCGRFGALQADSGDLPAARITWTACDAALPCQQRLFWSYAADPAPQLQLADRYGRPLCEQGDDDAICKRLVQIGSSVDYQAVLDRRRQRRIDDIQKQILKNTLALPLLEAQVRVNQANADSQTGLAHIFALGTLKLAQSELSSTQRDQLKLQAELQSLSQPQ